MSLISALNIGKSALAVHQAALQVTSSNVANAGNPDYTRQVARIIPGRDTYVAPGMLGGGGVSLESVQRQIDDALEGRLRSSMSDSSSAQVQQEWMGRVESIFNAMGDDNLSTRMGTFFSSWSKLANKPQDPGLRQLVLQNGDSLAAEFQSVRGQLTSLQGDVNKRVATLVDSADGLLKQVASLNGQILLAEGSSGTMANGLRDQRDAALKQLSQLMDIKVQDTGNGSVNVLMGSEPLVVADTSYGVAVKQDSSSGVLVDQVVRKSDGNVLSVSSGQVGALIGLQTQLDGIIDQTDTMAGNLIFDLNKLHASGQGLEGYTTATASNAVSDVNAALNLPAAGLPNAPTNGSFVVHVTKKDGLETSTLVKVDLDGLNGDDTTLEDLRASLDAIDGVSATIVGGKLKIDADSNTIEFGFSQDSSGALAALGINAFFTGSNAADIAVSAELKARPNLLAAAANGQPGDNQTALAIGKLASTSVAAGGRSLDEQYQSLVNGVAASTANAKTNAEAAQTIQDTLSAQRESLSGVSLDEEAVNLIREQRAFQGAARVISAVDEMLKTLLQMA